MGYRRLLLTRWSRRDWLAVGLVALTAVFLAGASLTLVTAGDTIEQRTANFDASATATYHDGAVEPPNEPGAVALPVAAVTVDGERAVVVGIPPDPPARLSTGPAARTDVRLPRPPSNAGATGPIESATTRRLVGDTAAVSTRVAPNGGRGFFPRDWYVANASTVENLGQTATLVVRPEGTTPGGAASGSGAVTVFSLAAYLLGGARQLVGTLALVVAGSSLLVGVALYSVTRMTVRDRLRTVVVARTTGAGRRQLLALFTARTASIAGVGVALGAAVGIITVNAVLNAAVSLGVATTLSPRVTASVLAVLGPALLALLAVGIVAGAVATWSVLRVPPAALGQERPGRRRLLASDSRLGRLTELEVLRWRALAPTTAALTVFAAVVLLSASVTGALAPLAAPGAGTITEPGASSPLGSDVDRDTARALQARGVQASPEIIVPQVSDDRPYLARGAEYDTFANLTGAELIRGRAPRAPREAVVGADLAATLDLAVGDRLTLGGGTRAAVDRVRVVGVYRAPGLTDDQLVIPLATANHLSALRSGTVHLVRVEGLTVGDDSSPGGGGATNGSTVVTGLSVPDRTTLDRGITAGVTVRNYGARRATRAVTVSAGDASRTTRVTVRPGGAAEATVTLPVEEPGDYTVAVAGLSQRVVVERTAGLSIEPLPQQAPLNATLLVIVTADGEPVPNATVAIGERTVTTNQRGRARLTVPSEPGRYAVRARAGDRTSGERSLVVASDATRDLLVELSVRPSSVAPGSRAEARLSVHNPWGQELTRQVAISQDGPVRTESVTLGPGETATVSAQLPVATTTGSRTVTATTGGDERATATYQVVGDDRVVTALLRGGGYTPGSGLGSGVEALLGNLQLLQVTLVVLATLMVLGSVVAGFAQGVTARRSTIGVYRVTGASPVRVLRSVAADAARIGTVAALLALGLAVAGLVVLSEAGLLTVFGVRIGAVPPLPWLLLTGVGAVAAAVVSAVVATLPLVTGSPAALDGGRQPEVEHD